MAGFLTAVIDVIVIQTSTPQYSGTGNLAATAVASDMVLADFTADGSLTATVVAALALWYFVGPAGLCYGVVAGTLIFWRHGENIARLRAGTENPTTLLRRSRVR